MDQATYETRCPQRYRCPRPAHFTAALECADFHDHQVIGTEDRRAHVCVVTNGEKHFAAAAEWTEHLRGIAALGSTERAAAIRAERLHDVDIDTVHRFVRAARFLTAIES
ncbi:hypothetical protein ACL02S_24025 [Nocardia sp. 004]|uniref:hypothetical protein n=1 Tax=Nocardia sp. 004 TaxID=3385978 RepID=UPI0039A2B493